MPLIQKTDAEVIAEKIDAMNQETISFLKSQLQNAFQLVNTAGQQGAIMAAFGANAVQALTVYQSFYTALQSIGDLDGVASANLDIFQPQEDGTVIFSD
jgi:hypothetical protein